jgi:uncharacterized protein YbjQ (UPF0145 family)
MNASPPGGSDEAPGESEAEQLESLKRVEAGGIPLGAERRLRELSAGKGAFTSDLSVGSFALCHELGLQPLAQVMGSSIYQVGYSQTMPGMYGGGFIFELDALSQAWNAVRDLAFGRLAEEAQHVGADAVVGVEISSGAREFTEGAIECVVIGTAVRSASRERPREGSAAGTVLTELSVPDFAKLRRAGFQTLGVVAWTSVFYVQSWAGAQSRGLGMAWMGNQEMTDYTRGIYEAREAVMSRVSAQAARVGASGVVGMRIAHNIHGNTQNGLIMSFSAIGTAIRESAENNFTAPKMIIDLTEGAG